MMRTEFNMIDRHHKWLAVFALLGLMSGCSNRPSGPSLEPVSGTVKYQGTPVDGARITFYPQGDTLGNGGSAKTDANGKYTVLYARGGEGLPAGDYRVVISKAVMPDGSEPPEDVEPMDSPAKETLPPKYSSETQSELTAAIDGASGAVDFDLE